MTEVQQRHVEPVSTCFLPTEPFDFTLSPPVDAAWLQLADLSAGWPVSPLHQPVHFASYEDGLSPSGSSAATISSDTSYAVPATQLSSPPACPPPPSPRPAASAQPCRSTSSSPSLASSSSSAAAPVQQGQPKTPRAPSSQLTLEQHRRADAQRRHRERRALLRLEELAAGKVAVCDDEQPPAPAATTGTSRSPATPARHKRKRHKLSVLEASAARIERLERALQASELANRLSEAQVRLMSEEISGMESRERRSMQWLDSSKSLRSAGLLGDRFACTLMDCRTGRLLDANSAFFNTTGFTPGGALQRLLDRLGDSPHPPSSHDFPLVRTGHSSPVQWVPLRPCHQYPATLQLLGELLAGKSDSVRVAFRCRWADGCAYEIQGHFWVVDVEWVEEADGSRCRKPLTFGGAASVDEYCRVEDD